MAEYIERYALLNDFYTASRNPWPDFDDAWKLVQNALSVDVAPVTHGRWIDLKYGNGYESVYKCSLCKQDSCFAYKERKFEYCPNCGAKMD